MEIYVTITILNVFEDGYIRTHVIDHSAHTSKELALQEINRDAETHKWQNLREEWTSQDGTLTTYRADTKSYDNKNAYVHIEIWRDRLWDR